jgi:hypothetical protein
VKRASLLLLAACTGAGDIGSLEQNAQPIDRLLLGEASVYPADPTLRERAPVLAADMAERRKAAWAIVERVIAPAPIAVEGAAVPRFQTWYAREEVLPMFAQVFRAMPAERRHARAPFTADEIAGIFPWNVAHAPQAASFTEEKLAARKKELETSAGLHSLNKDNRVLMSPDYVGHLFQSYGKIIDCNPIDGNVFAPCLDGEFPVAAAAVKTRWMTGPVPTYDTSPEKLAAKLASGTFGAGDGTAAPDASSAYTMRLGTDTTRLVALHIMTKELRDWAWITLWWSDTPNSDFGADRPASITGAFANYKMCVVTAYEENDHTPTWCSNPYLETQERAAKTNCIGCHQHGGTGETAESILAAPEKFPDFSRTKIRSSFPSDYAFTTVGGLEIAAEMRTRVDALSRD